ncbi:DUF1028 domain-containing protein [Ruania albidiflava]|uniref:DUF1028 domain-containing protein n=1 Tax=Ruania albidiflava TaxID=366586 RepID=UPI0003B61DBF|nr:DUF1028 domain-containing protein [Ruania albidiflava]
MTYTVLALDHDRTAIGVATASCALAVGAVVPGLDPRVGAVASQAWTNERLRGLVLGAVRDGDSPAAALDRLGSWDHEVELRQVGVLGVDGRGSAFTGRATTAWRGHEIDDGVVVLGNVLTGPEVLWAMREALRVEGSDAPAGASGLAATLVRALAAGEAAGGDSRGRQSAAVLVGAVGADVPEYDLRVDDAVDPVGELGRLVDVRAGVIAQRQ